MDCTASHTFIHAAADSFLERGYSIPKSVADFEKYVIYFNVSTEFVFRLIYYSRLKNIILKLFSLVISIRENNNLLKKCLRFQICPTPRFKKDMRVRNGSCYLLSENWLTFVSDWRLNNKIMIAQKCWCVLKILYWISYSSKQTKHISG